jgi:hypothetical protein
LLLAKVSKKTVSEENKNNRKDEADDKWNYYYTAQKQSLIYK